MADIIDLTDDSVTVIEYTNGNKEWYKHGELHRDGDLPAKIVWGYCKEWYKDGKRHRDGDLPAVEWQSGTLFWFKDGKLHRDGDLPAKIFHTGRKEWYKNGEHYRDGNGYVVEWSNGAKGFGKNGKIHHDTLHAVEWPDGTKDWYTDGVLIKSLTLQEQIALKKIFSFLNRVKIISRFFGVSPATFSRISKFTKSRDFTEWWYHPDNPGGKRHKRLMSAWLSETFKDQN